ncbi:helix-turn-helix transcriptional regulator [Salegentibacter sp. F188]|uniref:Helix-turn-helix transcriptional regulator n=1 Tax=Autumnicola patrickiae TaxID=3075591 RepID=A0ABU3E640_9FLAO|nr:helix-turn-helix transcriptional regulator [Salegentibacter sp. F188]MDT0691463.1 helix-turn-helix transcriptional regulator [Salegentibacter sp. F188]
MDNTIRVERAKLDISQQDLAEKVNVSRQTIHSIERGKKIPSVELAIRIAQFFKVSVEEIFSVK